MRRDQGVVAEVMNNKFAGTVELQQVRPRLVLPKKSGEAVVSLAELVVDLRMLVVTIEDDASPPVHDSPREADMQQPQFDSLLTAAATGLGVTGVGAEPPFQYLVTTTTPPPPTVRKAGMVVLELSGGSDEGLLLKRRIGEVG